MTYVRGITDTGNYFGDLNFTGIPITFNAANSLGAPIIKFMAGTTNMMSISRNGNTMELSPIEDLNLAPAGTLRVNGTAAASKSFTIGNCSLTFTKGVLTAATGSGCP